MELLPLQPGDVPDTFADVSDLVEQFEYKPNICRTRSRQLCCLVSRLFRNLIVTPGHIKRGIHLIQHQTPRPIRWLIVPRCKARQLEQIIASPPNPRRRTDSAAESQLFDYPDMAGIVILARFAVR